MSLLYYYKSLIVKMEIDTVPLVIMATDNIPSELIENFKSMQQINYSFDHIITTGILSILFRNKIHLAVVFHYY